LAGGAGAPQPLARKAGIRAVIEPLSRLKHPLFLIFFIVLVPLVALLWPILGPERAILSAFDGAALVFIAGTFLTLGGARPDKLRETAARNDAGRLFLLVTVAALLLVILIVVGLEIGSSGKGGAVQTALATATLLIAWCFGNLVYTLHYAHLYYDSTATGEDHAGLAFPGTPKPDFRDFCYFAFVIGMTFQVSDVQIFSARIRRPATVHAIAAFLFNVGIVALTVNIVASAT
jgi:uncharacterized membrane protein